MEIGSAPLIACFESGRRGDRSARRSTRSGAVTKEQLLGNLRSLDITMDLKARPVVAQLPEEYWTARGKLPWE